MAVAGREPGFDVRDMVEGAGLLAATANVIMQLARPEIGYGVLESTVEHAQVMRHPVRRWRSTVTYLSVALLGTPAERRYYRRLVGRSHAQVRSAPASPVAYDAFDPELQLWVAACLYRGMSDMYSRLHGQPGDEVADAIYHHASRFGTTLQVPEELWPADRAAFGRYWEAAQASLRVDPPVRAYLDGLIGLRYLPGPVARGLAPFNRFVTTGLLPPPFRDLMGLGWSDHEQRRFDAFMRTVATANRLLPGPARRLPFNAFLLELRARARVRRSR